LRRARGARQTRAGWLTRLDGTGWPDNLPLLALLERLGACVQGGARDASILHACIEF
jgi:hypothetical protein